MGPAEQLLSTNSPDVEAGGTGSRQSGVPQSSSQGGTQTLLGCCSRVLLLLLSFGARNLG